MRKQEVKGKVLDRFPSVYPKAIVAVMVKIVELIKLENWKTDNIEGRYSQPKDRTALGFLVNCDRKTVERALNVLLHDGFIEQSPANLDSYSVNTSRLFDLPSKFMSRREHAAAVKRENTNRMRITRLEKMIDKLKAENASPMRGLW